MGNLFRTGGGGGKIKRTQVFSGNSVYSHDVDIKGYEGWQNFTLENFVISRACLARGGYTGGGSNTPNVLGSYDAKNGILHLLHSQYSNSDFGYTWSVSYDVDLIQIE